MGHNNFLSRPVGCGRFLGKTAHNGVCSQLHTAPSACVQQAALRGAAFGRFLNELFWGSSGAHFVVGKCSAELARHIQMPGTNS